MAKKELTLKIKGEDWTVTLLTKKQYEKLHLDDSAAITITGQRRIDVNKTCYLPSSIKHELFHAFYSECCVDSSNLTADQVEETCATIVGEHVFDIIRYADIIMTKFLL